MDTLAQHLRFALRLFRRSPFFTAVATLTISLGIGATTTIFSVVNAVLLRPPPGVRNSSDLIRLHRLAEDGSSFHPISYPNFEAYRDGAADIADLAATRIITPTLDEHDGALAIGFAISHNFFDVLGVRPALGRFFVPEEDVTGAAPAVVLSHGTWRTRFGADSTILGRSIRLSQQSFTVVGIAEESFRGPVSLMDIGVWIPIAVTPVLNDGYQLDDHETTWVSAMGRLRPDVTREQVEGALNRISASLRDSYPNSNPDYGIDVYRYSPIGRQAVSVAAAGAALLFALSGMILLIASVNVGSMLLTRASERSREIAVRLALGASRLRVVTQLLVESVLLFALGAGGGLAVTILVTKALGTFQLPIELPLVLDFAPDARALVFSLLIALLTGVIFGLTPALHATRPDISHVLKTGTLGERSRSRLRSAFVVAQVAGSSVLLVIAGLFGRSLLEAQSAELGFDPSGIHFLSSEIGVHQSYTADEALSFYQTLEQRLGDLPQVQAVGIADWPPVVLGGQSTTLEVGDRPHQVDGEMPETDYSRITPRYLETLSIPLVQGRVFSDVDRRGSPMVAIVNQTLANRVWPGENPVGKTIQLGAQPDADLEIVGIAANATYRTRGEAPRQMVYVPYAQWPQTDMVVLVRTTLPTSQGAQVFGDAFHDLDPDLPIDANTAYTELLGLALLPNRAAALFSTVFGALGLLLAAIGLYGMLTFTVAQRRHEIGIRMALGAPSRNVRGLVLGSSLRLVGIGLAIGLPLALALSATLRTMLYGVSPADPVTFGAIVALLAAVALLASYLPAMRATSTDPIQAIRAE